jgi:hypothetical protein
MGEANMLRIDATPRSQLAPARADTLTAARAEVISRLWQAVSYIEEARADLKGLRQSGERDAAMGAILMASTHLTIAAGVLVPQELAQRARSARKEPIHNGKAAKRLVAR